MWSSVLVVNAEVDSMGGVVEGGVGIANKTSPRKAAIEKVQAELRQEYGVRDERKRELEFLEKGGNPLDFKLGNGSSVSVQSTSINDQHPDQFVTSEAKGSFAVTASPHGDSVESSGRPGPVPCEPNSADNLMLFDAEHEFSEGARGLLHPSRSKVVASEPSPCMDGNNKTQEHGDSAAFSLPRKAYKRRNRSRLNRDGSRSTDVNLTRGSHVSSLPSRHGSRDVKALASDSENQKQSLSRNLKPTSPGDGSLQKTVITDGQEDTELNGLKPAELKKGLTEVVPLGAVPEAVASESPLDEQINQQSFSSAAKNQKQINSIGPETIQIMEEKISPVTVSRPSMTPTKTDNQCQMNGFNRNKVDEMSNDAHTFRGTRSVRILDSESSCTPTILSVDGNIDGEMCTRMKNVDSNGKLKNQSLHNGTFVVESDKLVKEKKDTEGMDSTTVVNKEGASACESQRENGFSSKLEKELNQSESTSKNEVTEVLNEGEETCERLESGREPKDSLVDDACPENEKSSDVMHNDVSKSNLPETGLLTQASTASLEQTSSGSDSKLLSKIDEDSILKEAQIIEAKRKRIAELSIVTSPTEIRGKSHWDYVLEEMAWLANDFAQERIWKRAAASQISYRVAVACQLRKPEESLGMDAKKVACTLAKAVMEFWHSVEVQAQDASQELEQKLQNNGALSVRAYAFRFLKANKTNASRNQTEVPSTPDRISDSGIQDVSWDDSLTEENLFYAVPTGAMLTYKKSIESHVAQLERNGSIGQEEVESSACNAAADFESQDTAYDEDEGETSTYNMQGAFERSKSSRYGQKKRKHLTHAYSASSYEIGSDLLPMKYADNKVGNQQSVLLVKRPGSNLNVSIPTKRMRTASRRVISPFGAGASGCIQLPNKTDASSGDTNSFQDDQSTLHGGLLASNNMEVESARDFEKQLPFDSAEVSTKPKKKKKAKYLNAPYEQRWSVDSNFQNEQFQRDHFKKRSESHPHESNGNSGLLGQPVMKKPKIMWQSQDNSFDNIPPSGGSVPSPVASQMSNMSNQNKFMKMLGGRDRGRKAKAVKMPSALPGSRSPWSLFEDQALVVLVHDLGPNWELVSDAINSTLHFKCIFRKAKDCKDRHNSLMDRTSGDGADSAEDSGSSQPYPSTLPGIPKGSARQLFQRLQGPMEEDTLKAHFEKIIMIGQKQHYRRNQNDNQDPKQLQQPHGSHMFALSQVCPNNVNGGPILTPLDLCDASTSGPDMLSLGYQGPHSGGLALPNQGNVNPMLSAPGAGSALQGSPNMMIGNNFSSSPGPLNSSARDNRFAVPRGGSLSADEQQRMQQYNQMMPSRNIPQANLSAPGALSGPERGVRILPGGTGMGMMAGVNRSLPVARPGFQGIPPPSMVNSGNMVSPGMSSANLHAGVGAGQGGSMSRPREALHMMRPGTSQDSQRQMMTPDLQMPGNTHFGGLSSSFPNQNASPPVSSYPLHHQQSHPISPQHPHVLAPHHPHFQGPANHPPTPQQQAYAIRLAKERQQLQHRFLPQQQQQFAASNSLMPPHVQSQPQLPISSPMPNSPQVQPQTGSPRSPSVNSMPQKQQTATQGGVRNAQPGLTNQTAKQQRQRQHQLSQANRQHPQQRQQQLQAQQAKVPKVIGRGNLTMPQNIPTDASPLNGVSTNSGNQNTEKGESASQSMQSQGMYAGAPPLNSLQPARQYSIASQSTNPSLPQKKMYPGQTSSLSSKLTQITSDNSSQGGEVPSHQKSVNQNQSPLQRVVQSSHQINNSDPSTKSQGKDSHSDQHPTSSSAEMDSVSALPPGCKNTANAAQWRPPEPAFESNPVNSQTNTKDSGSQVGQRPATSLPSIRHDVSTQQQQQQQQQQSQVQQPHSPAPQPQQPLHSQQQQQAQLLKTGNSRSSDPRSE